MYNIHVHMSGLLLWVKELKEVTCVVWWCKCANCLDRNYSVPGHLEGILIV